MEIKWTEPEVKCELVVRCARTSRDGVVLTDYREPTLGDMKFANEELGLMSDYVGRDAEKEKLTARIAELEAEREVCLDAMAERGPPDNSIMMRHSSVIDGIHTIQRRLESELAARIDRGAELEDAKKNSDRYEAMLDAVRTSAREQMAEYDRATILLAKMDTQRSEARARIAELESEREAAIGDVVAILPIGRTHPSSLRDAIDAVVRLRDAEAYDAGEASKRIADLEVRLDTVKGVNRRATQAIIECIGSVGPESADDAAGRIVSRLETEVRRANDRTNSWSDRYEKARARVDELEAQLAASSGIIDLVHKVLTEEARYPASLDVVERVRGLANQANGLAQAAASCGEHVIELEAKVRALEDTSTLDRAMDKFVAEDIEAAGVLDGIDRMSERLRCARDGFRKRSKELDTLRERIVNLEKAWAESKADAESWRKRAEAAERRGEHEVLLPAPIPTETREGIFAAFYAARITVDEPDRDRAGILAVVDAVSRVRPQCLIARAVASEIGFEVWGSDGGKWMVRIGGDGKQIVNSDEVPSTLARMIWEATK